MVALSISGCGWSPSATSAATPTPDAAGVPPLAQAAAILAPPVVEAAEAVEAALQPTIPRVTSVPISPTPTATATPPLPSPTGPTAIPTPSPRAAGTPPRVGLQVGHWKSDELPDELARLRGSTGARWGDVTEAELNYDIAVRVQALLVAQGVVVDLLPATVPPSYDADAFIAIHADGSTSGAARGWKIATPWRTSEASRTLLTSISATYGPATALPEDVGGITVNMKGYYAFNYRRHVHAIARTTPAVIVEMGFMTSAADRGILFGQPDRVARGIADGIILYLNQRDPNNGAALLPPEYPALRTGPNGATLRTQPRDDARVVANLPADARLFPIDKRDGWYQVFVRGQSRLQGWVREDQVVATDEQPAFPTQQAGP